MPAVLLARGPSRPGPSRAFIRLLPMWQLRKQSTRCHLFPGLASVPSSEQQFIPPPGRAPEVPRSGGAVRLGPLPSVHRKQK